MIIEIKYSLKENLFIVAFLLRVFFSMGTGTVFLNRKEYAYACKVGVSSIPYPIPNTHTRLFVWLWALGISGIVNVVFWLDLWIGVPFGRNRNCNKCGSGCHSFQFTAAKTCIKWPQVFRIPINNYYWKFCIVSIVGMVIKWDDCFHLRKRQRKKIVTHLYGLF